MSMSRTHHLRRTTPLAFLALAALAACATAAPTPAPAPTQVASAPNRLAAPDDSAIDRGGQDPAPGTEPAIEIRTYQAGRSATDASAVIAVALAHAVPVLDPEATIIIEGIDFPGPGAAVVTMVTVHDGRVTGRWAAGVVIELGRAAASGDLWPLPVPSSSRVGLLAQPLLEPSLLPLARAALDEAGLGGLELVDLAIALESWPIIAHVLGPDGVPGDVWLRRDGDHLTVAGLPRTALASGS